MRNAEHEDVGTGMAELLGHVIKAVIGTVSICPNRESLEIEMRCSALPDLQSLSGMALEVERSMQLLISEGLGAKLFVEMETDWWNWERSQRIIPRRCEQRSCWRRLENFAEKASFAVASCLLSSCPRRTARFIGKKPKLRFSL